MKKTNKKHAMNLCYWTRCKTLHFYLSWSYADPLDIYSVELDSLLSGYIRSFLKKKKTKKNTTHPKTTTTTTTTPPPPKKKKKKEINITPQQTLDILQSCPSVSRICLYHEFIHFLD